MDDPCPIELKKTVKQKQAEHEAEKNGLVKKSQKKRNLKDKERVLYAPYTNIGCVNFEKTTGYINIPDTNVVYTRIDDEFRERYGKFAAADCGGLRRGHSWSGGDENGRERHRVRRVRRGASEFDGNN